VIAEPPSDPGRPQLTNTLVFPGLAATNHGADGTVVAASEAERAPVTTKLTITKMATTAMRAGGDRASDLVVNSLMFGRP
jgi:hypothetical protein